MRWKRLLIALMTTFLVACGSQGEEGPTDAELLSAMAGRTLTPAEVATKLETADLLCSLDVEVLRRIWLELEPEQVEFQNFVFTHRCPGRELEFRQAMATTTVPATTSTTTTTTTTRPLRPTTSRPPLTEGDAGI